MKTRKIKAMTLVELLLVLALIGILLSLAVPKLMPLIGRTKSLEAQMQLRHLLSLEKNFYYMNSKYTSDVNELGFEQEKLVTSDGKANYLIEIVEASTTGFVAKATAVVDFDQDGVFNIWQISQDDNLKELSKD